MTNILIGATGSIAAIKIPLLVDFFQKHPYINVKVVVTESAHFFVKDMEINCPVYREQDEWNVCQVLEELREREYVLTYCE